jgi:hypothetical protein
MFLSLLRTLLGSVTHHFTALDISAGTPEIVASDLDQIHALESGGLSTGVPTIGTPALGQVHALAAQDITASTPEIGTPALGQVHALTALGIAAGDPIIGTPALGIVQEPLEAVLRSEAAQAIGITADVGPAVLATSSADTSFDAGSAYKPSLSIVARSDPALHIAGDVRPAITLTVQVTAALAA